MKLNPRQKVHQLLKSYDRERELESRAVIALLHPRFGNHQVATTCTLTNQIGLELSEESSLVARRLDNGSTKCGDDFHLRWHVCARYGIPEKISGNTNCFDKRS